MKSILLLCAVAGAVSDASKCQADENTLLQVQGRNTMRKTKIVGSKDSKAILEKMRDVANSLVEGSDTTMSEDDVTDSLDAVIGPLTELSAAILQQVANAQQQITDASSGFQSCSTPEEASLRASMEQRAAAVESCQNTLDQLRTAETQQCRTAEDCLCDEARVRTTDQEALCGALTESYEVTFCEHHNMCANSQQCHSLQAEVYQRLTADVQAEMALVVEEYIAVEQSLCMNRLSRQAMTPSRRRSISRAALDACDDVDVSALSIRYPAATAPPACPAPTHGEPQCGGGGPSQPPRFRCELGARDFARRGNPERFQEIGAFRGYTKEQCQQECAANPECLSFNGHYGAICHTARTTTAQTRPLVRNDNWEYCEKLPDSRGAHQTRFEFMGCYRDGYHRDLHAGPSAEDGSAYGYTSVNCNEACAGYSYFALQNGGGAPAGQNGAQCFCGNAYGTNRHYTRQDDGRCGPSCVGDEEHLCGSAYLNAVYRTAA